MLLSSADKKAAHDGFKFLVLSPSGARKCYCTTVKEAKREAGKGGKIVSLGRMRYTTQNPRKRNPSARMVGLQRNPKGKGMVPFSELAVGDRFKFGGDKCKKISKTKFQIEASGPFPATTVAAQPWYNVEPLSKRNPTWTTAAILAGGAYIYGRSAKVRGKLKEAIDRAHAKLENPTARMVGMQRNPGFPVSSPPVSKLVKELGITVEEAKHIKALASQGKPKTALKYANDAISRGHYLAHGVESLYPEFPHFYYVNMGDTYDTTLYYDGKALRIGDWGSYVERHSR